VRSVWAVTTPVSKASKKVSAVIFFIVMCINYTI
jgi:hypothetical protein